MLTKQQRELIIKLKQDGKRQQQISHLIGCSQAAVSKWISKHKSGRTLETLQRSGRPTKLSKARLDKLRMKLIDEVKRAFSEFNRVLRKQGILYDYVKAQMGTEKTETVKDKLSNEGRFVRYYTLDEMRQFIEENGFELIHLEQTKENLLGRSNLEWIAAYSRKS